MYKYQTGGFRGFDPDILVTGMKLMHFYPLFLYDTETAVIPDFGPAKDTCSCRPPTWTKAKSF